MAYSPYFVGPYQTGLKKDLDSYLIPEDAFPELENAYLWRGRVYKKGGYQRLGLESNATYSGRLGIRSFTIGTRGAGADTYNLTITTNPLDLTIQPGTLFISDGVTSFTDNGTGGFVVTPGANGTVNAPTNYATSAINITFNVGNAGAPVVAGYLIQPNANSPVMGLSEFDIEDQIETNLVAFDLVSAYQFNRNTSVFNQTRFYKSEAAPQAQTTTNLVNWTGTDTDFFFTSNYQGALFATNNVPGAHFYSITAITKAAAAQVTTSVANNLAVGDVVYFNNVTGMTQINGLTGRVTVIGNPFTVNINSAAFTAYTGPSGIAWTPTLTATGGGDGIRWFDGYTAGNTPATGWVNFNPPLDSTAIPQILLGALLILPYKGYLIALNTVEGTSLATGVSYSNRARWSQVESPGPNGGVYYAPPYPVNFAGAAVNPGNEWYSIPFNTGGFADAPTSEDIVSAEYIKDTLVVYFEASTWKLSFTGNSIAPFQWEKINAEIGATSTFSIVPFDKNILSIGPNGAYACDSINVDRIDRIIPDEVFNFLTTNANNNRIHGIRDFFGESVQWTFLDNQQNSSSVYPTKTLYYNYLNNSFSIFKNCFTCFSHFYLNSDLTWATAGNSFDFYVRAWNSYGSQSGFPIVVSGNQQGFVFQMQNSNGSLIGFNDTSLVIQNITAGPPSVFTVINHNLQPGDTIIISKVGGATGFNGNIYQVSLDVNYTQNSFSLKDYLGNYVSFAGYTFGGYISIVDNFTIQTKNLNPFFAQGKSIRMGYTDFYVDDVPDSQVTVYLLLNDDTEDLENAAESHVMSLADPSDINNTKFWTRVYFNSQANFITLQITYDASQLYIPAISQNPFVLHGSIFWMKPTGRLLD